MVASVESRHLAGMSYEFFFSYTRGNANDYLMRFFEDLCTELREQKGLPKNAEVAFFDQNDIELGEQWEKTIATALQHSKVMVCVYSPGYFKSPYCGKEWRVFHMRREAYRRRRLEAGEKDPHLPPVIKPVFWLAPLPTDLDEAVAATQYIWGDPADEHNLNGLKYVLQKLNDYQALYTDYVRRLATEIREAAANYPLPQLEQLPALVAMEGFQPKIPVQAAAPVALAQAAPTQPKHVRFVFVAGDPTEFGAPTVSRRLPRARRQRLAALLSAGQEPHQAPRPALRIRRGARF